MGQRRALGAPALSPAPGGVRRASLKRFSQPSPPTGPAQPPAPMSSIETAPAAWHQDSLKSAGASQSSLSCTDCPSLILADLKATPGFSTPHPQPPSRAPRPWANPSERWLALGTGPQPSLPSHFQGSRFVSVQLQPPLPSATKPVCPAASRTLAPGLPWSPANQGAKGTVLRSSDGSTTVETQGHP